MLDFVLVVVVLAMTAVTLLYATGCLKLWESDTTRDTAVDALPSSPKPSS